jgi:hypothetical protein
MCSIETQIHFYSGRPNSDWINYDLQVRSIKYGQKYLCHDDLNIVYVGVRKEDLEGSDRRSINEK